MLNAEEMTKVIGIGGVIYLHDTADGAFIYCRNSLVLCKVDISNSPVTSTITSVAAPNDNYITYTNCESGESCVFTINNSKFVAIDCS